MKETRSMTNLMYEPPRIRSRVRAYLKGYHVRISRVVPRTSDENSFGTCDGRGAAAQEGVAESPRLGLIGHGLCRAFHSRVCHAPVQAARYVRTHSVLQQ